MIATKTPCNTMIKGKRIGNSNPVIELVKALSHITSIPSKIVPDIILPVNLKESEITLAKFPIISSAPTKREIRISKSLANSHSG